MTQKGFDPTSPKQLPGLQVKSSAASLQVKALELHYDPHVAAGW